MEITFRHKGNFKNTEKLFSRMKRMNIEGILSRYGEKGVEALSSATPKDTGKTAGSWSYTVKKGKNGYSVSWKNSNVQGGVNIALILQYGHGTGNGGYVQGIDYINPALKPIFDSMAEEAWREVTIG